MNRNGDWLQTYLGFSFYPLDCREEDFHIRDIAHGLSLLCRFGGHCKRFYSVAEHSVIVSRFVSPENAMWGLLHDASEAYIGDVVKPLKYQLSEYRRIEKDIMAVICKRFNLSVEEPPEVKKVDMGALAAEKEQNMNLSTDNWNLPEPPLNVTLAFLNPEEAERAFLDRFHELSNV